MPVFLDTETTGLYSGRDEVLQIGVVDDDGAVLMNTLVRPIHATAWQDAQDIHGIAPEHVADAPTLDDVLPRLADILHGQVVVIYNAAFDCGFLPVVYEVAQAVDCCMLMFAAPYGEWNDYYDNYRWQRLGLAARYVLHDLSHAHDAVADALACRAVYRYLTDPAEHARIDAVHEQRRIEREEQDARQQVEWEVEFFLSKIEGDKKRVRDDLQRCASNALMRQLGMPMYQVGYKPVEWRERDKRTEEYCRLFFNVPLDVVNHELRLGRTLAGYTRRADIPANLKPFSFFRGESPWVRKQLVRCAYLFTGKAFSWLYGCAQVDAIRAQHPLRRAYTPAPGFALVTRTQLKRVFKIKPDAIAAMTPVIEVESKHAGWIPMYEMPDQPK